MAIGSEERCFRNAFHRALRFSSSGVTILGGGKESNKAGIGGCMRSGVGSGVALGFGSIVTVTGGAAVYFPV